MKNDIIPPRPSSPAAETPQEQSINNTPVSQSPKTDDNFGYVEDPGSTATNSQAEQMQPAAGERTQPAPQSQVVDNDTQASETSSSLPKKHPIKTIIAIIIAAIILIGLGMVIWYQLALRPVATGDVPSVRVTIAQGSSPAQIGQLLQEEEIIRSQFAFDIYTRMHDVRGKLQAGDFSLSPAESTAQIIGHLTTGQTEQYAITFYPGATLNIASTAADKTPSHRQVLEDAGFSTDEINEAFAANYDHPLFADKPRSAGLEGYIYGETYQVAMGASAKQILERTFDEYYSQIQKNNLLSGFKAQGLSLHEAIILASIVQREVPTKADQKQVAQVFYTRLESGMMLGSDVTYHYAADKRGVPRDNKLEDPYNTRINTGLPPGPIASPGISALQAVAEPAEGDFVYFLSGDDDKTYYARTNAEHEANIVNHCSFKCSLP